MSDFASSPGQGDGSTGSAYPSTGAGGTRSPARASQAPAALAVESVSIAFGGVRAVDGMSLAIEPGGMLGLIGPNGAGKTTMFNLIAGTLRPDAGRIAIGGVSVEREAASRRVGRGLARTFQLPRPFLAMSVLENMLAAPQGQVGETLLGNFFRPREVARQERAAVERARELLDFLQLARLQDEEARVLSGGQRKLLEFGRALMADPAIVLLDEPAAGVNPALLDFMIDRIATINARGMTVLLIEHNMDMIRRLCPRVLVMAQGRRLAEGSPDEVVRNAEVIGAYLGGAAA
ncbi:ABC transporter ATP-binding protein [Aureimonas glaciei]|uniref:ABC transporter ATP-binding protein n=2 Tax=Aureimonas glaciei TaxID=1776957 RepID=A0A917DBG5_9HYPH|nr:ABC transporter ATP-binding protein [Aureimonas glaciei]